MEKSKWIRYFEEKKLKISSLYWMVVIISPLIRRDLYKDNEKHSK